MRRLEKGTRATTAHSRPAETSRGAPLGAPAASVGALGVNQACSRAHASVHIRQREVFVVAQHGSKKLMTAQDSSGQQS
eukprot:363537-Chlamydomonas_euryale.AAC.4